MSFGSEIEHFIQAYSKEIAEKNAAIFVGAGLSVGAGYVDWKGLLKPIAYELGLDIAFESDLVSLVQYYVNEAGGNRGKLNRLLIEEFSKEARATENHDLLARLPISVYWTTNYDKLIERALEKEGRRPDVKHQVKQLQLTKPGRDAVVYKMHGDADHPADAVLVKDDYERYHRDRQPFLTALSGDLVSMTFLFLGLSFTDPNLDYILSRVRIWLEKDVRPHYAILRRVPAKTGRAKATADRDARRQELFIHDLKRFGINVLLIDDYADITHILARLYKLHRGRSVLISGSAYEYGRWGRDGAETLVAAISKALVTGGYRIVSGFGLGIGRAAISGALEKIYADADMTVGDRLILRPFPQSPSASGALYTRYRNDLISLAGTAVFVFGNRLKNGKVVEAPGVEEEFKLAVENGLVVIPIGATGYAAAALWRRVMDDFDRYFPKNKGIKGHFAKLGQDKVDAESIVSALTEILARLRGSA
jgi:hypothetical protein